MNSQASTSTPDAGQDTTPQNPGRVRWLVCALLFFAATVNYMDRQVIGLLKPTLQAELGWTEIGYSNIVLAFTMSYGIGSLVVGKLIDRLGTRIGFALAVLFWSISAMAHAAATSILQFAAARFSLGIGEAGSFRRRRRISGSAVHSPISEQGLNGDPIGTVAISNFC